ncbi:MAG: TetR/AcrR family transcriptional regulator [Acidaminococcaceae bacterium]|nr:TetR/AcrR family transcriptional regulator [Acidaminococcaceae bacterium]MBQ7759658.1 TetR/AcrR family transcriptional regulator [Acidaminococcaceae bacterium]
MQIDVKLPKETRIKLAAEEIFSKYGYEKATLDSIIALADVGKGTVYKYFGNKEQLFYKLVAEKNIPFVEALQQAVDAENELESKLIAYFTVLVDFYRNNRALWQIIYFEMLNNSYCALIFDEDDKPMVVSRYSEDLLSEEFKERYLRYHGLLISEFNILKLLVEYGMNNGELKQGDARISASHLFFGVAMGIFHHTHQLEKTMSYSHMAKIIVDRFLYGEATR